MITNLHIFIFLELSSDDSLLQFSSTPLCLPVMTLLVVLRRIPLHTLLFPNDWQGAVVLAGTCEQSFFLFPSLKLRSCYSTVIQFMQLTYILT